MFLIHFSPFTLYVDRLEDPIVVTVYPKVLHVPLNQSAEFTCKAKSATDYELKWTRGMHGPLPRGAVNSNGVLKIKNTQSIHGGSYTCTGKNSFSDDMASVQLRVGGEKRSLRTFALIVCAQRNCACNATVICHALLRALVKLRFENLCRNRER